MYSNMDNFELSPPLDLSHHLSDVTKYREASTVKQFYKYFAIPGIGNLAGGLPHPSYFPFDTLESKSALPHRFKPTANNPVDPSAKASKSKHEPSINDPASARVLVPHDSKEPDLPHRIDLNTALQYGTAQGYPPLYLWIREFALTRLHPNIPYKNGAEVILTCGNTDGFAKSIECFTDPWSPTCGRPKSERQAMLCEQFAYMNAIQTARPRGLNCVPVAIDAEGMLAYGDEKALYNVLSNWDVEKEGSKRPHIMYTVTMGQNPTSGLLSVKRRREIYEICQKFDVLIIEDDPYFYIQFPHAANAFMQKHRDGKLASINHFAESNLNHQTSLAVPVRGTITNSWGNTCSTTRMKRGKSSGYEFLDSLVPSYLSLDVDGRVIRLDTFSKTIAPGCRLGWLTAQPAIVERILRITETSTQQPSGFVQSIVAKLIIGPDHAIQQPGRFSRGHETEATGWKMDGWVRWLEGLRGNYERRMITMCEVLEGGKFITSTNAPPSSSQMAKVNLPARRETRPVRLNHVIQSYSHPQSTTEIRHQHSHTTSDASDSFEVLNKIQVYDFIPPMAGMFAWIHYDFSSHPAATSESITLPQLSHAFWIFQTTDPYLVLTGPGSMFAATDQIREEEAWQYFRLCFAAVDEEAVKDISERFVRATQDFWELDEDDVKKLLEDDDQEAAQRRIAELSGAEQWTSPLMC